MSCPKSALLLLAIPLLTAGCANNALTGTWKGSVSTAGASSFAEATVEFKKNGGFTEVISTPAGTLSGIGTYTAKGDEMVVRPVRVTFNRGDTTLGNDPNGQTVTLQWEGDTLTLLQGGGTITLHRMKP
jgi:hypothetical protein